MSKNCNCCPKPAAIQPAVEPTARELLEEAHSLMTPRFGHDGSAQHLRVIRAQKLVMQAISRLELEKAQLLLDKGNRRVT